MMLFKLANIETESQSLKDGVQCGKRNAEDR